MEAQAAVPLSELTQSSTNASRAAAHATRLGLPRISPENAAAYLPPSLNAFRKPELRQPDDSPAAVGECGMSKGVRSEFETRDRAKWRPCLPIRKAFLRSSAELRLAGSAGPKRWVWGVGGAAARQRGPRRFRGYARDLRGAPWRRLRADGRSRGEDPRARKNPGVGRG